MTISAQMFPLSGLSGSSTDHIDRPRMLQLAKNKRPLSSSQLEQMLNEHLKFLDNSGAGGDWTTLVINGIVLGLYDGFQPDKGKQAHFEHLHLKDHCSLQMQILPFSNCCGLYAKQLQGQNINLSYSILTDAHLPDANFQGANLRKADFSRAVLTNVNFQGADLRYVDFENSDLTGADFRRAKLEGARFPGANILNTIV